LLALGFRCPTSRQALAGQIGLDLFAIDYQWQVRQLRIVGKAPKGDRLIRQVQQRWANRWRYGWGLLCLGKFDATCPIGARATVEQMRLGGLAQAINSLQLVADIQARFPRIFPTRIIVDMLDGARRDLQLFRFASG